MLRFWLRNRQLCPQKCRILNTLGRREFAPVVHSPTSSRIGLIRLEWFWSMFHRVNVYQAFLSNGTDSRTALLPTHCHIVIVHVHGGDPECHVGMISPLLFGFKNLSSVLVKASAKHRLYRSEADSRCMVTQTFEMWGTKCSFKHTAKKEMFTWLQQLSTTAVWSVTTLKAMSTHDPPSSQVGYVLSSEEFNRTFQPKFHLNDFRRTME